jgi:hypothetical protein
MHHIISDGWSMGILVQEMARIWAFSTETFSFGTAYPVCRLFRMAAAVVAGSIRISTLLLKQQQ